MLTSASRMYNLKSQITDLEFEREQLVQAKSDLASQQSMLVNVGNDVTSKTVQKQLNARRERLHLLEKALDQKLYSPNNQLELLRRECQLCEGNYNRSVGETFSNMR